jgi:hypothetical protein
MVTKFSEQFQELINIDVPREMLSSVEDRGGYIFKKSKNDLIQTDIKYAEDGFIAKYCMENKYK